MIPAAAPTPLDTNGKRRDARNEPSASSSSLCHIEMPLAGWPPPELEHLCAPVTATLAEDGTLIDANEGFLSLIGMEGAQRLGAKVGQHFIQPDFATLNGEPARADKEIYAGLLTIEGHKRVWPLQARVWRDDMRLQLLADHEIQETARSGSAIKAVNNHHGSAQLETMDPSLDTLQAAIVFSRSQAAIILTDASNTILDVNPAFTRITGYSAKEAIGQSPELLASGHHDAAFFAKMAESLAEGGFWEGEIWSRRKDGEEYTAWLTISSLFDFNGELRQRVRIFSDITDQKIAAHRIHQLAFFDQLTGLPNRGLVLDRLHQTMALSLRNGNYSALLFIDLDNFKTLNTTLGHGTGDLLLKQAANRLVARVRAGDTVARLGGDEFVLILPGLGDDKNDAALRTEAVCKRILDALSKPYSLGDSSYHATASIGATVFNGYPGNIDDVLKHSDLAMYKAKAAGRNTFSFFDPSMESAVRERAALEADLREAVAQKQFELYYQAQIAGAGRLTGAEVLVRWQHPARGMILPDDFIPLAEETGLIVPLGEWVLEAACAQLAAWATRPEFADLMLSVNISVRQFQQPDFVDLMRSVVQRTDAKPQRLRLELTESLMANDLHDIIGKMSALKAMGVTFSLDDFGTGYSSLSQLKLLPLEELKIDRSFVRDVLIDPNDATIARTIVALAQNLGLGVIAEGVETLEQQDFLARSGCNAYQGFFFSRPLPIAEFERFVCPPGGEKKS